jgi:hypothetical protein
MGAGTVTDLPTISRQRWLLVGLLLIFIVLSVQYAIKVEDEHRSAILRWRPQIQQIDDVNIYQRYTYPNPPIMALLLKPLLTLPPRAASLTWFYLKVAMTLAALAWTFRLVESPGRPFPLWAKALAVVLSLRPIMGDLTHGNINLFILFLVMAALFAFHRNRDLLAGVILGLAIACKVTPALFLPYFLWKRSWLTLAGCALGLVLFLVVVPGLFLGMEWNLELVTSWYDCMVRPFLVAGDVTTDHPNQSLPGLLFRWLTPRASFFDKGVPQGYLNVTEMDPLVVRWLMKGCMAVFAALIVWSCRTPTQPRHGWRLAAEFGLVLVGMLLFSERTWKHHCVTLLLPFAVVAYCLANVAASAKMRAYLVGSLGLVLVLMMSTSTGWQEDWNRVAKLAQADGAYVWANLVLIAAMVTLLRQKDRPAPVDGDFRSPRDFGSLEVNVRPHRPGPTAPPPRPAE